MGTCRTKHTPWKCFKDASISCPYQPLQPSHRGTTGSPSTHYWLETETRIVQHLHTQSCRRGSRPTLLIQHPISSNSNLPCRKPTRTRIPGPGQPPLHHYMDKENQPRPQCLFAFPQISCTRGKSSLPPECLPMPSKHSASKQPAIQTSPISSCPTVF